MIVDDFLPIDPSNRKICFGHSAPYKENTYVIWVSLLEKAWAKLNSNYDRIIMGTIDMGFNHLCGVPSLELFNALYRSRKDELWN